jgi:hypothetical protein
MSVTDPQAPVEPVAAPIVPTPTPATEAPPAPPAQPTFSHAGPQPEAELDPMVDPFEYGQKTFPREYVEQLRIEAANRRVALRTAEEQLQGYNEAFAGLSESDRETLLQFTRTLAQDPMTAAEWMVEQGTTIREQAAAALQPEQPAGIEQYDPNDPNRPLTIAEFQRLQAAQYEEAQRAQLISHWNREAARLGYNPMARPDAAEGPTAWLQFQQLVKMAEITGGNLEKAHNLLAQQSQAGAAQVLQQRVEQVRAQHVGVPPSRVEGEGQAVEESSSQRWQRINDTVNQRLGQGEPIQ